MSLTVRHKAHEPASLVHTEAVLSLIKGNFKGPVCLDDKDPILIEQVLEFLYTGNVTDPYFPVDGGIPPDDSVFYHGSNYRRVPLYAEADYFLIDDLKQKMMEDFRRSFLPYGPSGPLPSSPGDIVDDEEFEDIIKEI
ncbi:BTB/POZ domain protein [Penicillium frequentans]|uniref:BTB/POZ domain protein n=1 Tax=Penicillium frequentans TaxID=3151616 RepID=A0AAD6GIC2_9EURO|nr:BTB/POZ domain protein [Penicillium glabrum]